MTNDKLDTRPWRTLAILLVLTSAVAAASAQTVDPRADRVLRDMGGYLASLERYAFEARIEVDRVYSDGEKITFGRRASVALSRPSRLHAEITGDLGRERIWYDGRTFSIHDLDQQAWSSRPVTGPVDEALDHLAREYGISSPLADFVYADPYAVLIENVDSGRYVGRHRVGRVATHHLAFRQSSIDWQIWVEDGVRPLPRKLVITYREVEGKPQFRAVLPRWDVDPRMHESGFRFEPPPGSIETDLFVPSE